MRSGKTIHIRIISNNNNKDKKAKKKKKKKNYKNSEEFPVGLVG